MTHEMRSWIWIFLFSPGPPSLYLSLFLSLSMTIIAFAQQIIMEHITFNMPLYAISPLMRMAAYTLHMLKIFIYINNKHRFGLSRKKEDKTFSNSIRLSDTKLIKQIRGRSTKFKDMLPTIFRIRILSKMRRNLLKSLRFFASLVRRHYHTNQYLFFRCVFFFLLVWYNYYYLCWYIFNCSAKLPIRFNWILYHP